MTTAGQLQNTIAGLVAQRNALQIQLNAVLANGGDASVAADTLRRQIAQLNQEILTLNSEYYTVLSEDAAPTASSGGVAATTQGVVSPTAPNGRVTVQGITDQQTAALQNNTETGTDAPTRTIERTQATPPNNPNAALASIPPGTQASTVGTIPDTPIASSTQNAGVGAGRDDSAAPTLNGTQKSVNQAFNQSITAQPNVLDKYASYTYSISWYLLTPQQMKTFCRTGSRNPAGWQLLIQSGGIPTSSRYSLDPANQIFSRDYYLDNLEIKSTIAGKGTNAAHNATELNFSVTEPNGLTLLNNLYAAVKNIYKSIDVQNPNYVKAPYMLAVRFYGYDEQGNLDLRVGNRGTDGNVNKTDPSAVVEKFYPLLLKNITFKMNNKLVEYRVEASAIPYKVALGTFHQTVPYNFELVGETLNDIFNGKQVSAAAVSTDGRDASNTRQPVATGPSVPNSPTYASGSSLDPNSYGAG